MTEAVILNGTGKIHSESCHGFLRTEKSLRGLLPGTGELIRECVNYTRHTAPGEGLCTTSDQEVGMSVYRNRNEAMAVFANLSERKKTVRWHFNSDDGHPLKGQVTVEPLSVKIVKKN